MNVFVNLVLEIRRKWRNRIQLGWKIWWIQIVIRHPLKGMPLAEYQEQERSHILRSATSWVHTPLTKTTSTTRGQRHFNYLLLIDLGRELISWFPIGTFIKHMTFSAFSIKSAKMDLKMASFFFSYSEANRPIADFEGCQNQSLSGETTGIKGWGRRIRNARKKYEDN